MIDAILFAVRDAIRDAGLGYSEATCRVMDSGMPPPNCGDVFVAVHPGAARQQMDNAKDDYYSFLLTLTMRVTIPLDRVGEKLLASDAARSSGFNARANALADLCHMDWGILQDANQNLARLFPDAGVIYGFCEPARYRGMEAPEFADAGWFGEEPGSDRVGLKAELRFEDCRRVQPIAVYS